MRYLLFLLLSSVVWGQTCTTAVCTAASTSQADVLAALPSNANANASVTVNIPSGTSTWTTALNYTIPAGVANPSAVTTLIIHGNTTVSCTGAPGTVTWSCPA